MEKKETDIVGTPESHHFVTSLKFNSNEVFVIQGIGGEAGIRTLGTAFDRTTV
jgi:hypothetical protein